MTYQKNDGKIEIDLTPGVVHAGAAKDLLEALGVIPVATAIRVGMQPTRHGIIANPQDMRGADAVAGFLVNNLGGVPDNVVHLFSKRIKYKR